MEATFVVIFVAVQLGYLGASLTVLWLLSRPVNLVPRAGVAEATGDSPEIILFYPVLREAEETMRTTFTGMRRAPYPAGLLRVISIPNADDHETIASLRRLQDEFNFLEVLAVPPTSDPSWERVWSSWNDHPGAYWWHEGRRAGVRDLPPKKTRQLIWAMYQVAPGNEDALLSYIDADSVIPVDYWHTAAAGMTQYDVLQNTNITGNLRRTWASSFHGLDHIAWDSTLYRHMSADGKHPFYVLGKGLFFRFRDLIDAGGFHPWLTIEDPEIGMRLWTRGKRLGVVESPLVEEVPATWWGGVTQRKRWVAGFFQSMASPLRHMGMTCRQRWRARLNLVPCLSLALNPIGLGLAVWATTRVVTDDDEFLPPIALALGLVSIVLAVGLMLFLMLRAWHASKPVLTGRDRVRYLLRVNPLFTMLYWLWWIIPLVKGFVMFLRDGGLVWERTEKIDANHQLIRADEVRAA